jgi:hypothetical protein
LANPSSAPSPATEQVRAIVKIDWTVRENVRA